MAFSSNGVEVFISSRSTREVIASYWLLGQNVKAYDDCVTEVVEYRGMNEADAKTKANGLKANNMADYRVQSTGTGIPTWWIVVPSAKGTIVNAAANRQGNSRMFTVTKVTETHTCSCSVSGAVEY